MKSRLFFLILLFLIFLPFNFSFATVSESLEVNLSAIEQPDVPTPGQPTDLNENTVSKLQVIVTESTALISFNTQTPTIITSFAWGETSEYEKGSSATLDYRFKHEIFLDNLTPDTFYYFRIDIKDSFGKTFSFGDRWFKTSPFELPGPQNLKFFIAEATENGIMLRWIEPGEEYDYIRIMRRTDRFPADPFDGDIVYEGRGIEYLDRDAPLGRRSYYTAFVVDKDRNFSSGSLASAWRDPTDPPVEPDPLIDVFDLTIHDVIILQENTYIYFSNKEAVIKPNIPFSVIVEKDKVRNSRISTVFFPYPLQQAFLFKEREDGYLEALIPSFDSGGSYPIILSFFGPNFTKIGEVDGRVIVEEPEVEREVIDELGMMDRLLMREMIISFLIFLILILLLLLVLRKMMSLGKKNREDKRKKESISTEDGVGKIYNKKAEDNRRVVDNRKAVDNRRVVDNRKVIDGVRRSENKNKK